MSESAIPHYIVLGTQYGVHPRTVVTLVKLGERARRFLSLVAAAAELCCFSTSSTYAFVVYERIKKAKGKPVVSKTG